MGDDRLIPYEPQFFLVFGLTRSGLEPKIYHTRGKHANHYTSDGVEIHLSVHSLLNWNNHILLSQVTFVFTFQKINLQHIYNVC